MVKAQAKAKRLTLADVRRVAKEYGAEVDERYSGMNGRTFSIAVDLPRGRTWVNNGGCHVVYAAAEGNPDAAGRSEACAWAIEQMRDGVNEPESDGTCGNPYCDTCNPCEE